MSLKEKLRSLTQNRIALGVAMFAFGSFCTWAIFHFFIYGAPHTERTWFNAKNKIFFDRMMDDPFFKDHREENDLLKDFDKMRKRLFEDFGEEPKWNGSWFGKRIQSDSSFEITQKEDDKSVYFEIPLKGLKNEKVNVAIEDGQVIISGEVAEDKDENGMSWHLSSKFHRSYPVPMGTDEKGMKMEQQNKTIIVRFPKKTQSD